MALIVLAFIVCWSTFSLYIFVEQFYQFMDIDFETKFHPSNLRIFYSCLLFACLHKLVYQSFSVLLA